jgi:hypothetical protein
MSGVIMDQEPIIAEILDYPLDPEGNLVTRRGGLTRMKPRLNAPPASQPGSVDWTMTAMFGSRQKAVEMIESLVAGQGDNADEKWVRVVLLYKQWQIQFSKGEIDEPPTLNQVCYSLNFDATTFIRELQNGVMSVMKSLSTMKAAMAAPQVVQNLIDKATSAEADTKQIELALKVGGVIESGPGMAVQINNNNTNQNAVVLKSDREKLKSPLLQFQGTVNEIDTEVRKEHNEKEVS